MKQALVVDADVGPLDTFPLNVDVQKQHVTLLDDMPGFQNPRVFLKPDQLVGPCGPVSYDFWTCQSRDDEINQVEEWKGAHTFRNTHLDTYVHDC
jgi:hypothetical protein